MLGLFLAVLSGTVMSFLAILKTMLYSTAQFPCSSIFSPPLPCTLFLSPWSSIQIEFTICYIVDCTWREPQHYAHFFVQIQENTPLAFFEINPILSIYLVVVSLY